MTPIGTKSLAELFGLPEFAHAHARVFAPGPMTPKVDPNFEFTPDQVRTFLLWEAGVTKKKGLLISGPTDCGKSSGIDQFAARTGRQVWRVGCHAKMEWQEVMGCLQFGSDGATKFVPGPVPEAAKAGGFLILEEMNFLPPGTIGAANTMLDGVPISIPETGEVIVPDADFRICATANAIDQGDDAADYGGTKVMNKALLRRFLTMRAGYLDDMAEAKLLHRVSPKLPGQAIRLLVEVLKDLRASFLAGELTTPVGHSFSCDLARIMEVRLPLLQKDPLLQIERALLVNGLDLAPIEDAKAVIEAVKSKFDGYGFATSPGPATSGQASSAPVQTSTKLKPAVANVDVHFLINPLRDKTGSKSVALWAMMDRANTSDPSTSWNGTILPTTTVRTTSGKTVGEFRATMAQKKNSGGYVISNSVRTDGTDASTVVSQTADALKDVLNGRGHVTTREDVFELATGLLLSLKPHRGTMFQAGLGASQTGNLS